jgi:hypothetical protein
MQPSRPAVGPAGTAEKGGDKQDVADTVSYTPPSLTIESISDRVELSVPETHVPETQTPTKLRAICPRTPIAI